MLEELKAPFPSKLVKWRVGQKNNGRGLALAYVDSRTVMGRFDEVLGVGGWQRQHSFGTNGEVLCSIGINIDKQWVWKTDGAAQTNYESEKGGLSDSFKRAAVNWGVGRYLYYLDSKWVNLKKGKIDKPPKLPIWATSYVEQIKYYYGQNKKKVQPVLQKFIKDKDIDSVQEFIEGQNKSSGSNLSNLKISEQKELLTTIGRAVK